MIDVTPLLFMGPEHRPSSKLLEDCKKGIETRNKITHATYKGGKYKAASLTPRHIKDAYNAVFRTYLCFVKALEEGDRAEHNDS